MNELKTKGKEHYDETMRIANEIMERRAELFEALAKS